VKTSGSCNQYSFLFFRFAGKHHNLQFFATVFNTTIKENYDLIHDIYVQIEPFKNRRAGKLSGGMKQKLALCCALIHKPEILFLDEPTTGVDTVSRKEFWHMLKQIKEQGITILVSTPYMDEATLCERIALIQNGKLLSINTPAAIINAFGEPLYAIKSSSMSRLLRDLRNNSIVSGCNAFGEFHHITLLNNSEKGQMELMESLHMQGHMDVMLKPATPSIEDCFIKLMN
jgi:ABC-type multidrug transport system ATPase subunit